MRKRKRNRKDLAYLETASCSCRIDWQLYGLAALDSARFDNPNMVGKLWLRHAQHLCELGVPTAAVACRSPLDSHVMILLGSCPPRRMRLARRFARRLPQVLCTAFPAFHTLPCCRKALSLAKASKTATCSLIDLHRRHGGPV